MFTKRLRSYIENRFYTNEIHVSEAEAERIQGIITRILGEKMIEEHTEWARFWAIDIAKSELSATILRKKSNRSFYRALSFYGLLFTLLIWYV